MGRQICLGVRSGPPADPSRPAAGGSGVPGHWLSHCLTPDLPEEGPRRISDSRPCCLPACRPCLPPRASLTPLRRPAACCGTRWSVCLGRATAGQLPDPLRELGASGEAPAPAGADRHQSPTAAPSLLPAPCSPRSPRADPAQAPQRCRDPPSPAAAPSLSGLIQLSPGAD